MSTSPSATLVAPSFEGDFSPGEPFSLEAGGVLASPTLRYAMYGEPNAAGDNVIFVAHALSGSARVADWWPRLFSDGGLLQTGGNCVIGINILGSCYGSTGPASVDPAHRPPLRAELSPGHRRRHRHPAGAPAQKAQHPSAQAGHGRFDRRHAGFGVGRPVSGTGRARSSPLAPRPWERWAWG